MSADWPVSAQEAAARLFAQALPIPVPVPITQPVKHHVQMQRKRQPQVALIFNQNKNQGKEQTKEKVAKCENRDTKNNHMENFVDNKQREEQISKNLNTLDFKNSQDQKNTIPLIGNEELNQNKEIYNESTQISKQNCGEKINSSSWNGWIPCFENINLNNNELEPILVEADTPTDEVRLFFKGRQHL